MGRVTKRFVNPLHKRCRRHAHASQFTVLSHTMVEACEKYTDSSARIVYSYAARNELHTGLDIVIQEPHPIF